MEVIDNSVLKLLYEHRYIFAFLGALFEGTYIMILSGVLFKFGYFNIFGLLAVLSIGYFLNAVGYYLLGRYGGHKILDKWFKRIRLTRSLVEKLEFYFKKHSFKTLFFTRITYGLSMYTLMIAGSFRMKWKEFFKVNLISTIVWVLGMGGLGYVFGIGFKGLGVVTKTISFGLILLLFFGIIALSFLIVFLLRKFFENFLKRTSETNNNSEDEKNDIIKL